MKLKIILDENALNPIRVHSNDGGLDLRTPIDVDLLPNQSVVIDTGVHIQLPRNTVGILKSKSGLNVRYGVITIDGVIDAGYTGSIRVKLYNHGDEAYRFLRGDKITQLLILPVKIPNKINTVFKFKKTDRGDGGFGSSGR